MEMQAAGVQLDTGVTGNTHELPIPATPSWASRPPDDETDGSVWMQTSPASEIFLP